jgi:hypothetical protein
MKDQDTAVERYLAAWNETDGERRRRLIADVWTDGARYIDPKLSAQGHAELDAMLVAVQGMFPGHRFLPLGRAERHHDRLRFRWSLRAPDGAPVAAGTDFATLAPDGRFAEVIGFLDQVPAGAAP